MSDLGISRYLDILGRFGTWTEVPDCLNNGLRLHDENWNHYTYSVVWIRRYGTMYCTSTYLLRKGHQGHSTVHCRPALSHATDPDGLRGKYYGRSS